jgi:hypothetical protein
VSGELLIGREWLEVRLHNPGPAPVRIDWAQASFTEPKGAAHSLISSLRLAQISGYLHMRQYALHNEHGSFAVRSIAPRDAWVEHRLPAVLGWETSEISVVLQEGESIREVLYPADHVRVGERGELSINPLLCGRGAEAGNQRTFTVRIPVLKDDQWEVVTLAARLR